MSKPHTEMNEGPEAFARFHDAMKTIISVPKSSVMPEKKSEKPKRARTSRRASRASRVRESKS